ELADAAATGAPASKKRRTVGRVGTHGLSPEGWRPVPGFEASELRVARCAKKLPKTQSWCFVPLIFSALGKVPEHLQREDTSTENQIADAQQVWENLFSHWS
ncbi:unnamed protein product, partial [Polarella glacialis]